MFTCFFGDFFECILYKKLLLTVRIDSCQKCHGSLGENGTLTMCVSQAQTFIEDQDELIIIELFGEKGASLAYYRSLCSSWKQIHICNKKFKWKHKLIYSMFCSLCGQGDSSGQSQ